MKVKLWHRFVSMLLVFALVMTILPTQRVYAADDLIGGQASLTSDDYDYIRLDSLVQNERTITVAYTAGEELVRFSSYVAGGIGENSVLEFAMPRSDKMTVEIYKPDAFGADLDIPLKELLDISSLRYAYAQLTPDKTPVGYLAGYLYDGPGSGSVSAIKDALRGNGSLMKLRNFDGYEMSGGAASGSEDTLPYAHNFVRWEGQYVPFEEGDAPTTLEEIETPWPIAEGPEDAGATEVLAPGYYILVFKYEYQGYYLPPSLAYEEARFLPIRVISGDPNSPEDAAAVERGYSCFRMAPGCGYTTMVEQMAGDPVELLTGSLNWNYTDLEIDGDEPLAFTRTYHSLEADNANGMGNGWTYSFYYRIKDLRNNLLLTLPTGGTLDFKLTGDGSYKVDAGNAYTLYRGNSGYLLTDESGNQFIFDSAGRVTELVNSEGKSTYITYSGDCFDTVSNASGTFTFGYSGGNITSVTDSAGRSISYSYDGSGNLVSFTNADGDTIDYTYNGSHDLTEVVDYNGNLILQNEYDGQHRVIHQYQEDLGEISYTYDDDAMIHSYVTEKGLHYSIQLDEYGRTVSATDDAGTISYTYDDHNRMATETDRKGNVTTYEYVGSTNRKAKVTYPDGTSVSYSYDENGNITHLVQRDDSALSYLYENGMLVSSTDANGGSLTYSYDANGHLASSLDALGNETTYTCNDAGLVVTSTDPLGNTTAYE